MEAGLWTARCGAGRAGSEPRGLPVDAPDVPQRVADLAQRCLDPDRAEHCGNHVLRCPRYLDQVADGSIDGSLVPRALAHAQCRHLLPLDLVTDPQDLKLVADRLGVAVDTHHLLLALLQGDLVREGRMRDPGHKPAVLDTAKDTTC